MKRSLRSKRKKCSVRIRESIFSKSNNIANRILQSLQ